LSAAQEQILPGHVLNEYLRELAAGEIRALELEFSLRVSLPDTGPGLELKRALQGHAPARGESVSSELIRVLAAAGWRYAAFRSGTLNVFDAGNEWVLAFERALEDEQLLVVNNLSPLSRPVKFGRHAGQSGWDILNRIEFIFPTRAQLEPFEFLWLLLNERRSAESHSES
jgi:hypothetical protein